MQSKVTESRPFVKSGELFDFANAFCHTSETDSLFESAMNEALKWHAGHCADYNAFLSENGLIDFKQQYSSEFIPPVFYEILRDFNLISVPEKQVKFRLFSDNTAKNCCPLILDARSHKRLLKITEAIFGSLGLINHSQKNNYICLTANPQLRNDNIDCFYNNLLTDLTAHRSVFYAVKQKGADFELDLETVTHKLIDFSQHPEPIRILGSAEHLRLICDYLIEKKVKLKLGSKSIVIFDEKEFHSDSDNYEIELRNDVIKLLGISDANIRKMFVCGFNGIPFITCEAGHFHIPIYSKLEVVEPETLLPVKAGSEGLVLLNTPYNTGFPITSVLTDYTAVIEENCPCGRHGKTFRLIGKMSSEKVEEM